MQDLLGGRIDYICEQVSTAVQQIKAGTVKPIATMGLSRSDVLPDLKTAAEEGFDLNCASLSAFEFPKGTPSDRQSSRRGDQPGGRACLRA